MARRYVQLWRGLLAVLAFCLMTLAAAAEPIEISGQLSAEQATEDGAAYAVFEVVTDRPAIMAVRSDDASLRVITYFKTSSELGFVSDRGEIPDALYDRGYRGEVTPNGLHGTWLFFIVTYDAFEDVDFFALFEDAVSVRQLDQSSVDPLDAVAAFERSGFDDWRVVQAAQEKLLSELMTLAPVRKQLLTTYDLGLIKEQIGLEETLAGLGEAELRAASLTQALEDVSRLADSRAFLTEFIDRERRRVVSQIPLQRSRAAQYLRRIERLKEDLVQLHGIDALQDHTGEEAKFRMRTFAQDFVAYGGQFEIDLGGYEPVVDVALPDYTRRRGAGGYAEPVIEAPVIVEESGSISDGFEPGTSAIWNPDDWSGTAFVKRGDIFRATHRVVLDRGLLELAAVEKIGKESVDSLGDASAILSAVLREEGFIDLSFQGLEQDASGFILATGLEQTDAMGVPLEGELRHSNDVIKIKDRSLSGYLRALFTSEPGYFRAILFLVSAEQYTNDGPGADFTTMQVWSDKSLKGRLPDAVADRQYTGKHEITALIYEFRKVTAPEFVDKTLSNIQASSHFTTTQTLKNHLLR